LRGRDQSKEQGGRDEPWEYWEEPDASCSARTVDPRATSACKRLIVEQEQ